MADNETTMSTHPVQEEERDLNRPSTSSVIVYTSRAPSPDHICWNVNEPTSTGANPDYTVTYRKRKEISLPTTDYTQKKKRTANPPFGSKMRISSLYSGIKRLTEEQRLAVQGTGFGHFIDMKIQSVCFRLGEWLADHFDWCSCQLKLSDDRRLDVTENDVHDILGLPAGGINITDDRTIYKSSEFNDWKTKWDAEFGKRVPKTREIILRWPKMGATDMFKTSFVCAIVSACISGKTDLRCNDLILPFIMDPDKASRINWCRYTIDKLVVAVRKHQESKATWHNFTGSLLFLNLFYFDKTALLGRVDQVGYPSITTWNMDMYKRRMDMEISVQKFGLGRIVNIRDCIDRHVNLANQEEDISDAGLHGRTQNNQTNDNAVKSLEAIRKQNTVQSVGSEQPTRDDNDTHLEVTVDECVRNVGTDVTSPSLDQPAANELDKHDTESIADQLKSWMVTVVHSWMCDMADKVDHYTNKLEHLFVDVDELRENVRTEIRARHFNKAFMLSEKDKLGRLGEQLKKKERLLTEKEHSMQREREKLQTERQTLEDMVKNTNVDVAGSSRVQSVKIRASTNCSGDNCFDDECPHNYVSPYAYKHVDPDAPLTRIETQVHALLCLTDDDCCTLYKEGHFMLTKEDFASLLPQYDVLNSILDMQSRLLNSENRNRSPGLPNRFFCSTNLSIILTTHIQNSNPSVHNNEAAETVRIDLMKQLASEFEDQGYKKTDVHKFDLVFVPVQAHEHFYVLVVDTHKSENWLLDNLPLPSDGYNPADKYGSTATVLVDVVNAYISAASIYEGHYGCRRSPNITVLPMPWQSQHNRHDCGVYALRHMETFMGDPNNWHTGLSRGNVGQMTRLRKRYMCKFLLHDRNENKHAVIRGIKLKKSTLAKARPQGRGHK